MKIAIPIVASVAMCANSLRHCFGTAVVSPCSSQFVFIFFDMCSIFAQNFGPCSRTPQPRRAATLSPQLAHGPRERSPVTCAEQKLGAGFKCMPPLIVAFLEQISVII